MVRRTAGKAFVLNIVNVLCAGLALLVAVPVVSCSRTNERPEVSAANGVADGAVHETPVVRDFVVWSVD